MPTVLITGGTGLVGKALARALLERNYEVIILTRGKEGRANGLLYAHWDIDSKFIDHAALGAADFIVHLAGAGVAEKRWSVKRKKEIVSSRVNSGNLLADKLKTIPNQVKAVISASGIGWYGPDPVIPNTRPFEESDPYVRDFLGETCMQWENSLLPISENGTRVVILRTGIVLSNAGGALKEFLKPMRFGISAILGSGKQVISWIHMDDMVNIYIKAIEDRSMSGVYNAVAPEPVPNKEFTLALRKSRGYKFSVPIHIPSQVLKVVLGEMSIEVLKSATVSSDKLVQAGYIFKFPTLVRALKNL